MRYMLLLYGEPVPPGVLTPGLWEKVVAAHRDFTRELMDAGAYVHSAPLEPAEAARTVRVDREERLVTDGPFAETKEVLGGYSMVEVDSLDAAVEWAHHLRHYGTGSIEVRPVVDHAGGGS